MGEPREGRARSLLVCRRADMTEVTPTPPKKYVCPTAGGFARLQCYSFTEVLSKVHTLSFPLRVFGRRDSRQRRMICWWRSLEPLPSPPFQCAGFRPPHLDSSRAVRSLA